MAGVRTAMKKYQGRHATASSIAKNFEAGKATEMIVGVKPAGKVDVWKY